MSAATERQLGVTALIGRMQRATNVVYDFRYVQRATNIQMNTNCKTKYNIVSSNRISHILRILREIELKTC